MVQTGCDGSINDKENKKATKISKPGLQGLYKKYKY